MRALICGTFNPPTNAHMDMGRVAQEVLGKDCIITYVPTGDQYIRKWKGYEPGHIMPEHRRLSLLSAAAALYGFEVSDVEISGKVNGKTYNTVKHFGFDNVVLCLGIDNIAQMKKWYQWDDLVRRTRLLVYDRDGYELTAEALDVLAKARHVDRASLSEANAGISSTWVRYLYRQHQLDKVKRLVPESVFKYLEETKYVFF